MFIWGFITSIFWAIVVAVVLWILCAFAGRLVNSNYRMSLLLHLLCFVVAVLSVVLLTVVFTCGKINSKLVEAEAGIAKLMMADGKFVDRLRWEINQASSTKNTEELTNYFTENFSEKISSEYSIVGKYMDMNQILRKTDFAKQISRLTPGDIDTGKAQAIVQAAAGEFSKGIRSKVKSVQRMALTTFIFLQGVAFWVVFYKAGRYRRPTPRPKYLYYSSDEI